MKNFILGFLMATALLAGGYFAYSRWSGKMAGGAAEQKKILYHCPMHPTYISDKPGDCPICGMKLVPMEPATSPDAHADHKSMAPGATADQTAGAVFRQPLQAPEGLLAALPADCSARTGPSGFRARP